ncbi:hypothetical protein LINPERHAP2_LOCUS6443 [Linum perenne]
MRRRRDQTVSIHRFDGDRGGAEEMRINRFDGDTSFFKKFNPAERKTLGFVKEFNPAQPNSGGVVKQIESII